MAAPEPGNIGAVPHRLRVPGGLANPGFTRVIDDNYHGDSVAMYFQFAKSFAYCFFYQFIFALPALAFAYYGSRVPSISRDIIGLYRFTLGNIGYVPSDSSFETDSACTQPANIVINASCVHIFSDYDLISSEFTYAEVSTILTVCELLQIMIFFITVFHIRRKLGLLKHEQVSGVDKGKVQLQDYSVFVMGLPSDSTLQELIQHFSGLYFLDRKDFRGRRPVRGRRPWVIAIRRKTGKITAPVAMTSFLPYPIDHLFMQQDAVWGHLGGGRADAHGTVQVYRLPARQAPCDEAAVRGPR